jgi:hypothetical protein
MAAEPMPASAESPECLPMVAVLTGDNQLTIIDGVLGEFRSGDCFEVVIDDGRIVLTPIEPAPIEAVWAKIAALGITEDDVADAVEWSRGH